jgi:hypothetical protein
MKVYIAGVIVAVIVSSHDALMPPEVLTGKLHPDFLRYFRCQTVLVPVFLWERDNKVMALYFPFLPVLVPVLVSNLTVGAIRPYIRIDSVNQHVLPENHSVLRVVNRTGVVIVLE